MTELCRQVLGRRYNNSKGSAIVHYCG